MEGSLEEDGSPPSAAARAGLRQRWERLRGDLSMLLGENRGRTVEIDDAEYEAILKAVRKGESRASLARMIASWKLEPTARRLTRVAEQAQGIAGRLDKGELNVRIDDHQLRLDPRGSPARHAASSSKPSSKTASPQPQE